MIEEEKSKKVTTRIERTRNNKKVNESEEEQEQA
jgi:hypothetical protein